MGGVGAVLYPHSSARDGPARRRRVGGAAAVFYLYYLYSSARDAPAHAVIATIQSRAGTAV